MKKFPVTNSILNWLSSSLDIFKWCFNQIAVLADSYTKQANSAANSGNLLTRNKFARGT